MTKSDEDSDSVNLFRVPTILQSQCSKASVFADETESNSKLSTAHTNESNLLVKTEQKVSFPIFTDEVKKSQTICAGEEMHRHVINHNYIGTNVAVCCENHCKKPMIKVTSKDSFDVQKMKDSDFVKSRVPFSLFGEEKNNIMTSQLRAVSTVHETEVLSKSITDLKISIEEEAKSASSAPLIIPVKLQETPPTVDNKENMPPEDYLFKHCERKPLSEIKVTNKFGDDVSNNEVRISIQLKLLNKMLKNIRVYTCIIGLINMFSHLMKIHAVLKLLLFHCHRRRHLPGQMVTENCRIDLFLLGEFSFIFHL